MTTAGRSSRASRKRSHQEVYGGAELTNGFCCGASYAECYSVFESGRWRITPGVEEIIKSIHWASSAGFGAIELEALTTAHMKDTFSGENLRRIGQVSKDCGILIPQISFSFLFQFFPSRDKRNFVREIFSQCLQTSVSLDAKIIEISSGPLPNTTVSWDSIYPGGPPSRVNFKRSGTWKKVWEEYVDSIGEICDMALGVGVKLALEPRPREMISSTDGMLALLKDMNASNFGVLFDTGHHFIIREIIPASIWKLGKNILAVHLSDNDGVIEHQWAPGEGEIEWKPVMDAFKNEDYKGYFTIESSASGVKGTDYIEAKKRIQNILRSL